jgi:hypothetical protein
MAAAVVLLPMEDPRREMFLAEAESWQAALEDETEESAAEQVEDEASGEAESTPDAMEPEQLEDQPSVDAE